MASNSADQSKAVRKPSNFILCPVPNVAVDGAVSAFTLPWLNWRTGSWPTTSSQRKAGTAEFYRDILDRIVKLASGRR
jgi:hypothetical protein